MDFYWNSIDMASPTTGKIFDIKKYAIHDGPGIRTTVFMKGCPLSCWWCHNPEGFQEAPKVVYDSQRCIGCHDCLEECQANAISASSTGMVTDGRLCAGCGRCVEACSAGARQMAEQTLTVSQLMEDLHQDILFYDQSGGGVTFSGGEPLFQEDFLVEALLACGESEIHRVVDTSGYAGSKTIEKVAGHTDLFLYDLKCMDPVQHQRYTGLPNKIILDNLVRLHETGANIIVRIPLIPGVNDDTESMAQVQRFLRPLKNIREIHLLPYHDFQETKYIKLDIPYQAGHISPPTAAHLDIFAAQLEADGFKVSLGG